ncbi:MAG: alpha-amylase [Anaerolineaceae bacterium]|nr:alpha-amylase [Anaerolineaceae bacterium]
MTKWPTKPVIYEINTWVWLTTLSEHYQRTITLENVPDEILDELVTYGLDAVWLMGVWARSPKSVGLCRQYVHEYRPALPDATQDDVVGSPYAVWDYQVDSHLGGRDALAALRQRLRDRGLQLVLDFVPNHVALDHPWVKSNPGYLIQGNANDLKRRPSDFYEAEDFWGRKVIIAHGRDPYFPGWADTAQVNAFSPAFRIAARETLLDIASQCDGLRCDMAMLLVNRIFRQTWYGYYDETVAPQTEFWHDMIPAIRAQHPDFKFIGEVYWNMEFEMQQLGFDMTYDKMLYDRLVSGSPREVRIHLVAEFEYQRKLVRFIENHDEPRAYTSLGPNKIRPALALAATLPGATLLHDGQMTGRKAKLPVQIGRQPKEPVDPDLKAFSLRLLAEMRAPIYQKGKWRLFNLFPAWSNSHTYDNLVAHGWWQGDDYRLVVVNLTDVQSQAVVNLSLWPGIAGKRWRLSDVLNGDTYIREGDTMLRPGLYVELGPYQSHILRFDRQP